MQADPGVVAAGEPVLAPPRRHQYILGNGGPAALPSAVEGHDQELGYRERRRSRMNDRFTQRVRKVLFLARDEAGRLQHDYIGTEHLLLGIIREGEGVAANVLRKMHIDFDKIQKAVEESVGAPCVPHDLRHTHAALAINEGVHAKILQAGSPLLRSLNLLR